MRLYAVSNDAASVMGSAPDAGITLGPTLTFVRRWDAGGKAQQWHQSAGRTS
jgi:hypothetical protein